MPSRNIYPNSYQAKEDLIRIHHFGVKRFGMIQADEYFDSFFDCFEMIAQRPLTQQVRYLDKLVDELAKGWKMEKILRLPL